MRDETSDAAPCEPATETGEEPRQRVERVPGGRRARLTAVAGTDTSPETAEGADAVASTPSDRGPNDDRLLRDVPPHYGRR